MLTHIPDEITFRYQGYRVFFKRSGQSSRAVSDYYLKTDRRPPEYASCRIEPKVLVLNEQDHSIFVETNANAMVGPRIDPRKRLVAFWGDSIVMGYGRGWIRSLSDRFPGYQFLNGGVSGQSFSETCRRAVYYNSRLPIAYNIVFPGWTQRLSSDYGEDFRLFLPQLVGALPNIILCTQPTSLNTAMIDTDPRQYTATKQELGFRCGYELWTGDVSVALAHSFWTYVRTVNSIVWETSIACRNAQQGNVPLIDLSTRFQTDAAPDFRSDFIDAGHFRVESYPALWDFVCGELETILPLQYSVVQIRQPGAGDRPVVPAAGA